MNLDLIYPMAAMVALTFGVACKMFLTRVAAVKEGQASPGFYKTYQEGSEPQPELLSEPRRIAGDVGDAGSRGCHQPMIEKAVLDDYQKRLNRLREELESLAETGEASAATVELDQSKVGRLSRMDAMQAQAMAQASAERSQAMLRRIDAAFRRIASGDFGPCVECEEAINPRRLQFDPTVLRCIDCASKKEK